MRCEFNRERRSTAEGRRFGMGMGEKGIETVGVGRVVVSFTRRDHFPGEIEPSAIEIASVINRPVLECLALFVASMPSCSSSALKEGG